MYLHVFMCLRCLVGRLFLAGDVVRSLLFFHLPLSHTPPEPILLDMETQRKRRRCGECQFLGCSLPVDQKQGRLLRFCSHRHAQLHRQNQQSEPKVTNPEYERQQLDLAIALSLAESTEAALSSNVSSELSCTSSRAPAETPRQLAPPVNENKDEDQEDMKRALALSLMDGVSRRSSGWSCPTCTFLNIDSSHNLCAMCARPTSAGPVDAASSVAEIVTILDDEQTVDDQPLSVIMTLSIEAAETYRLCRADAELAVSMSFDDRALLPSGAVQEWTCLVCTFSNSRRDLYCYMCESPNAGLSVAIEVGISAATSGSSICGFPGCNLPIRNHGFCSPAHQERAIEKRIVTAQGNNGVQHVLVGDNGAFTAHLLRKDHPQFDPIKLMFLTNWTKPGLAQPIVERIFYIHVHPDLRNRFEDAAKRGGNVQRHFHGTQQAPTCTFAVSAHQAPCSEATCNVCSIVRSSFNFAQVGRGSGGSAWSSRGTNNLRYGPGLYFSPVSSKSHDYNNDSEKTKNTGAGGAARNWRCMFVVDVAVGKAHVTKKGQLPQVVGDIVPYTQYHPLYSSTPSLY